MSVHTQRNIGIVLVVVAVVIVLGIRFALAKMLSTGGPPKDAIQKTVKSKDGTLIAYEQTGAGPVVILVSAALADRDGARPLADATGQPVFLFGSSSGSVLALDAASRFGAKIKKLFLYEPPFIVDTSHAPIPDSLQREIQDAVAANKRNEALALFFGKGMGIPAVGVTFMRLFMPAWGDMAAIAHTAPYDLKILAGTQLGKPLPSDRWSQATSPAIVAVGAKSEAFFHSGAKALTALLPAVEYRSLDGLDHSAVLMAPQALAAAIRQYFANSGNPTASSVNNPARMHTIPPV